MGYERKFSGEVAYIRQVGIVNYNSHELFMTWRMMNVRCYDDRHKAYDRYGGRGITVCHEWRWDNSEGFKNFLTDMFPRPDGMTIDRTNNHEGYSKANCKWATKREQQNNMSWTPKRDTGVVGVLKDGENLRSIITVNDAGVTVGIFKSHEIDKAKQRYEEAISMKFTHTDEEIISHFLEVDGTTPNGKRFYSGKTSKYYGVCWSASKNKWRAYVNYRMSGDLPIKQKHVGYFNDEDYAYEQVLKVLEWVDSQGYIRGKKGK